MSIKHSSNTIELIWEIVSVALPLLKHWNYRSPTGLVILVPPPIVGGCIVVEVVTACVRAASILTVLSTPSSWHSLHLGSLEARHWHFQLGSQDFHLLDLNLWIVWLGQQSIVLDQEQKDLFSVSGLWWITLFAHIVFWPLQVKFLFRLVHRVIISRW